MSGRREPKVNKSVVEKALRHINHHGGIYGNWYVGIEEKGWDRDDSGNRHIMRYQTGSQDEAKLTMSSLLGTGLMADDEYGVEPKILFIYTDKPTPDEL